MGFPVAHMVKNLPALQETWVWSLNQENTLEKGMATHSSTLAWRIQWTEEPGRLQSTRSQRLGHSWATNTCWNISRWNDRMYGVFFKNFYGKKKKKNREEKGVSEANKMKSWEPLNLRYQSIWLGPLRSKRESGKGLGAAGRELDRCLAGLSPGQEWGWGRAG